MVDILKKIVFRREYEKLAERERGMTNEVNRRVADVLTKIDPFERVMKEFHGVFGEEMERAEEALDEQGRILMLTWGYQNADHPAFKRLTSWIMNTQGNETLKRAAVTPERILYGRAQISSVLLFVKEVKRLSEAYKDMIGRKGEQFDKTITVE